MQAKEIIDFWQYWFVLKRRWQLAATVFVSVLAIATVYTLLEGRVYEAKGKLLIKNPNNATSAIQQENIREEKLSPIGRQSDSLSTEAELIRSASIVRNTIAALDLKIKPEDFLKKLRVRTLGQTDILEVSYQSANAEEVAAVVNQVMRLYLENNVDTNRTEVVTARQFISGQLPITEAIVRRAETNLRKFEEENNALDLEKKASSAIGVIENLENQINATQAKLANINRQAGAFQQRLGMRSQQAISANAIGQSPEVQKALDELTQLESQLATARITFQESHPKIRDLKGKQVSLKALLKQRVAQIVGNQQQPQGSIQKEELRQQAATDLVRLEAERLGLVSQVSSLSKALAAYKQRASVLPKLKQQKRELERELNAAQSTYETLLKRLEEIRVEENRNVGNARLVERAEVPLRPIAPQKARNIAIGGLLGLLLAVGAALLREELDTSVKTVKEAREIFGYALLGVIPLFEKLEKLNLRDRDTQQSTPKIVVRDTQYFPVKEAYRMLKANLKYLNSDANLKSIVVTSSVPQEGKSTVSANLAVAIAESEQKVLLIDADMRQPSQHKIWNLLNQEGLSNVLVGQAELSAAIKEVMPNLHVLPAGVIPPNPMALLESKRMASLMQRFLDNYDFVIVDTPSLNVAADAPILGKMSDGILLVVRPMVVDTASAAASKEFLEQSGQKVLGQAINGANSGSKYYSYYAKESYAEENSTIYITEDSVKPGGNARRF